MSLRARYRLYRSTVWRNTPAGVWNMDASATPPRGFAIVTGAYPRSRALAEARGERPPRTGTDARANERLRSQISSDGGVALDCVGAGDAHEEESFWVWDVPPLRAMAWGRAFDQFAVVAGDGRVTRLIPCFPEAEPTSAPDVALILHAPGDSPDGAALLLERELFARGWDHTRFLRPAISGSPEDVARSVAVHLADAGQPHPMIAIGLGESGLLAIESDAPWRIGIATPWQRLDPESRARHAAWPGWGAIHGGKDERVPARDAMMALPRDVPRLVDPDATGDLHSWVGRAADGVMRLWSAPTLAASAAAAGWATPGYRREVAASADPNAVQSGLLLGGGLVFGWLAVGGAVVFLFVALVVGLVDGATGTTRGDWVWFVGLAEALVYLGVLLGLGLISLSLRARARLSSPGPSTDRVRRYGSAALIILAVSLGVLVLGEFAIGALAIAAPDFSGFVAQELVFTLTLACALLGVIPAVYGVIETWRRN